MKTVTQINNVEIWNRFFKKGGIVSVTPYGAARVFVRGEKPVALVEPHGANTQSWRADTQSYVKVMTPR